MAQPNLHIKLTIIFGKEKKLNVSEKQCKVVVENGGQVSAVGTTEAFRAA